MTSQLRRIRQELGMQPKAITSGIQLPEVSTREQLDAIRDQGIAEMNRDGFSQSYLVWQEFCRRGIDQQLPSMRELSGLATDEMSILQETMQAAKSEVQRFDPERMHESLKGYEYQGVAFEDWNVHDLLDSLSLDMAEAPSEAARSELMQIIGAVKDSPYGVLTNSIEVNQPDELLRYEVPSMQESSNDWYTQQREAAMRPPQGLSDLAIGDGYGLDGLKGVGAGGGQYSVAHDAGYQQAMARGDFDGDDE